MKKICSFLLLTFSVSLLLAQDPIGQNTPEFKKKKKIDLSNRAGDHLMVQLSSDHWTGTPDSIKNRMTGLSRGANIYVMMDKPFKTNPHFSVAFGIGIGTSNIFFKKTNVDIKAGGSILPFTNLDTLEHFKKFKLATSYLEVPIEFRFTADPEHDKKSIKGALGVKVGTLLSAHTKGKSLEDRSDKVINSYTEKINRKNFFNSTRLSVTGRIGYGIFSVFGSYQVNNMFKDGVAPVIKPFQVGISLSGL